MAPGPKHRPLVRVVEMVMDIRLMRARHRRDGEVDDREEQAEEFALGDLLMFADDMAVNEAIAHAIEANGFESDRAQRLMRQRAKRRLTLLMGGADPEPEPPAALARAA